MRVIILSHPDLITKWVCLEEGRDTVKIHGVALHKREARVIKERRFLTKEEMENLLTKGKKRRARMCPLWLTSTKVRRNTAMHHTPPSILDHKNKGSAW